MQVIGERAKQTLIGLNNENRTYVVHIVYIYIFIYYIVRETSLSDTGITYVGGVKCQPFLKQ